VVECLPSECEALSSNPVTPPQKKMCWLLEEKKKSKLSNGMISLTPLYIKNNQMCTDHTTYHRINCIVVKTYRKP
jgi:hypothetical protein